MSKQENSAKSVKYFIDTEFIEDGRTIDLISIAIVREDGKVFYRQNVECDFRRASDFVWRNVYPLLDHFNMSGKRLCSPKVLEYGTLTKCDGLTPCPWATRDEIRRDIFDFVGLKREKPEFWGYYADYDWVAFCQLFGRMIELPKGFPMYCRDLKQLADALGIKLPVQTTTVHHALHDAIWVKDAYLWVAENFPNATAKQH